MPEQTTLNKRRVFTIGHSNHDAQTFVNLLKQHRIDVVADVRSQPYSKYATHFNADKIKSALADVGVRYVFLGRQVGGRPDDPQFYDADGYVLYDRLAASPSFLEGIERLEEDIQTCRVAVLCSEENPTVCHRNLLVGRVLIGRGVELWHIRADGRLQSQAELDRESCTGDPRQQLLFEEFDEKPWRSKRSVSPRPQ
jgi:uncharacterized protein (DUF488 family)